jgi:hypothetical protein
LRPAAELRGGVGWGCHAAANADKENAHNNNNKNININKEPTKNSRVQSRPRGISHHASQPNAL